MVCELDAKTRTKRLFVVVVPVWPMWPVWWASMVGSAGAEAKCHTSRSVVAEKESTSMIRYKYVVAVAVAVAQGTEK